MINECCTCPWMSLVAFVFSMLSVSSASLAAVVTTDLRRALRKRLEQPQEAAKVQPTQPAQPSDHSCSSYSLKGATYVIKSYEVKHQVFSNSEVCHGMSDSCVEFNAGLPAMIRAMSYLLSVLLPIFCQVPKWMLQRRLQVVQIMRRATKRERNIST